MPFRDLSHPLSSSTPVYPGDPPVDLAPTATVETDGYRVTEVGLGTHAGTHVDAPAHTEANGRTIDEYPPERFVFDAVVVDLPGLESGDWVGVADLERVEDVDPAADADLLVLHTGWDAHWGTERYVEHPALTPAAAEWCADRGCDLGLDFASPDPHGDAALVAHHALLGSDRLILENLANLDGLPRRVRVHAQPLPLDGADGSPVRAVAEFDAEERSPGE